MKSNRDVLVIVAVAFVLHFSLVGLVHTQGYASDEREYVSLATKLAQGHEFLDSNGEWSTKAPLWPFVLSLLFRVLGNGLLAPHIVGCLLGSLAIYLSFKLSLVLSESRFVALLTSSLLSLYPSFIVYSGSLFSETMYMVFMLLTFIHLERLLKTLSTSSAAFVGVYGALAALTRAVFLGFFVFLLFFIAWKYRGEISTYGSKLAIAALVLLLVLAPWTVRNFAIHGTFVPISSWGGMSLLLGNNPYSTGTWSSKPGIDSWLAEKARDKGFDFVRSTEIQRSTLGQKLAIEFIVSNPTATAKLWLKKLYMHWVYPITNSDSNTMLQAGCVVGDMLLYSFAGISLMAIGEKGRRYHMLLAAIFFFTTLQVVLHCEARYRLPIMPLIAIFASAGIAMLADRKSQREFLNVRRSKILAGSWISVIIGVYSFTAWQFLSGRV